jgi:hypothetical protein
MPNRFHQANEITLLGWKFGMVSSHCPAEKCNGPVTLIKGYTEARTGSITFHNNVVVEIR